MDDRYLCPDGKVQEVRGAAVEWLRQKKTEDPATSGARSRNGAGSRLNFYSFATLLGRSDGSR